MGAATSSRRIATNGIYINVVEKGDGPLVLFVHGWPELSHSWRHQIDAIGDAGYKAAAIDVRGYGESDKPWDISAYAMKELVADIKGVIETLSPDKKAVLVGHDWGAPIVHATTLLAPDHIRAVVGMSVVHSAPNDAKPTDLFRMAFPGKFFYILYFQTPGIADTELGRNTERSLRIFYHVASGEFEATRINFDKPDTATFLEGMPDPGKHPSFLTDDDFEAYVRSFSQGGWRGPLNRYRNIDGDWELMRTLDDHTIKCPSLFIGGAKDGVRYMIPGMDMFESATNHLADCRGVVVIEGAGHWVQQENPGATNAALLKFLAEID